MSTTPMSLAQFGQTIKAKHPEYNDLGDIEVGQKVLAKYPQYADMVQQPKVPQAQLDQIQALNANPTQFEKDRSQRSSVIGSTISNLLGMGGGAIQSLTGDPMKSAANMAASAVINDQLRAKNGYNVPYRVGAQLVPTAPAMEHAAATGDTNGVYGGAIAPAAVAVGTAAASPASDFISSKIPNVGRAGAAMNAVKAAAGDIPIDVGAAGDTALRTQDLAASGGSMPKVMRDFIRRTTDPSKGPLTYSEAQDFYSNATRMSAAEMQRLTPVMRRQVAMFTDNLGKAMKGAADQVGMGDQLVQGKAEYSQAMKMQALRDALIKKAIPVGVGGLVADHIITKALSRR